MSGILSSPLSKSISIRVWIDTDEYPVQRARRLFVAYNFWRYGRPDKALTDYEHLCLNYADIFTDTLPFEALVQTAFLKALV